eukprot:1183643-Prorocentrum_minimum.AAC.2
MKVTKGAAVLGGGALSLNATRRGRPPLPPPDDDVTTGRRAAAAVVKVTKVGPVVGRPPAAHASSLPARLRESDR